MPTSLPAYPPTSLRILGIDPGFDRIGFGIVDQIHGRVTWVFHDCVQTKKQDAFSVRLQQMRNALVSTIEQFHPNVAAVEKLFFQTNVKTAMDVSMARGVILLACADAGLPIVEMTPNQLKQGITGYGKADKSQVQEMVQRLLKLKEIPQPDDAADALAIAIVGGVIYPHKNQG